jgi:flagellar M-ring protein FliF
MDFLNRAIAQVTDLFRSMTPGARITTGLLLLLVPISIAYLFTYHASGPDAYLLNGQAFQPSEMQAMLLAFGKANLNSYEIEGPKIRIPQAQRAAYLAALAEHNALPENFSDIMQKTVENGNFFIPSQQREEMHRAAIQRQLGLAIRSMTGIQNAYVMYDPDNQQHQFNRDPKPTASVSLKPMGSERLSDAQVHAIRALVSRAIAGLKPESVAIIDLNTGTECGRSDLEGAVGQGSGQYGDQKRTFEQEYKRNIQGALSYVPGVTVTANVELDPELSHTEETIQQDAKTVPLETSEKTHTSNSDAAAPGGRPGYQAQQATNAPMQLSTASAKGTHQEE